MRHIRRLHANYGGGEETPRDAKSAGRGESRVQTAHVGVGVVVVVVVEGEGSGPVFSGSSRGGGGRKEETYVAGRKEDEAMRASARHW